MALSPLRRRLEPFITPLFRTWWRFSRGMTLGVRGIACDDQGRVMLVRHSYMDGWYLPGGGVESGEIASEAIVREMMEEAGIEATAPPTLFGFYANHHAFRNDHVLVYRFLAWKPCPPLATGEILERGFFAMDALPKGVTRGSRRRLAEAFEGVAQSADW